jgi:hypothetical protein
MTREGEGRWHIMEDERESYQCVLVQALRKELFSQYNVVTTP